MKKALLVIDMQEATVGQNHAEFFKYHHFPEQGRFRNEAFRVLRPNGRLYICDPRFPWAVRTILNACFKEAGFHTTKRNAGDFIVSGFKLEKLTEDLYVQVLSMKKPDEHKG